MLGRCTSGVCAIQPAKACVSGGEVKVGRNRKGRAGRVHAMTGEVASRAFRPSAPESSSSTTTCSNVCCFLDHRDLHIRPWTTISSCPLRHQSQARRWRWKKRSTHRAMRTRGPTGQKFRMRTYSSLFALELTGICLEDSPLHVRLFRRGAKRILSPLRREGRVFKDMSLTARDLLCLTL